MCTIAVQLCANMTMPNYCLGCVCHHNGQDVSNLPLRFSDSDSEQSRGLMWLALVNMGIFESCLTKFNYLFLRQIGIVLPMNRLDFLKTTLH